jgi:hypothetical protein
MNINNILEIKKRRYVRSQVTKAIRSGRLVKGSSCALCSKTCKYTSAHHIDYGRPLDVMWLCSKCHGLAHTKDHKLNPINNDQTPMPYIYDQNNLVQVSVLIPVSVFRSLFDQAQQSNETVSGIIRNEIMKKYPKNNQQLEFDFRISHDNTRKAQLSGISGVVQDKNGMFEQKIASLQNLRGERGAGLFGMESELFDVFARDGRNAPQLQRACPD